MLLVHLKITLRNLFRNKGFTFINISGLAAGFAAAILIILWINDELNFNTHHQNYDNIYRVTVTSPEWPGYTGVVPPFALAPILHDKYPEIKEFTRIQRRSAYETCVFSCEDKRYREEGVYLVDKGFFRIFTFDFIHGNPETCIDDLNSIVMTESAAKKYFGDQYPVGKVLHFNGEYEMKVSGVIKDIPANSEVRFDIAGPIELLGTEKLNSWSWESYSYILAAPGTEIVGLNKKVKEVINENQPENGPDMKVNLFPFADQHLHIGTGDITYVYIFGIVAFFILLVACINYMNLSTAKYAKRSREVGVRKVFGANRKELIFQFLRESLTLSFISFFFAVAIVEFVLPWFNEWTGKSLSFLGSGNISILLFILLVTILTGLTAGIYPAFFLSSFRPAHVLKEKLFSGKSGAGFRRTLVVGQFAVSIILIISTITVLRQFNFMMNKDLGLDKENVIYVPMNDHLRDSFESFRYELTKDSHIESVMGASSFPTMIGNTNAIEWEGKEDNETVLTKFVVGDAEYLRTLKINIVEGRDFSRERKNDEMNFVINRKAADMMKLENPLGAQLDFMHLNGQVIGIMDGFHNRPLESEINPLVLIIHPHHREYFWKYCFIRVAPGDINESVEVVKNSFNKFAPEYPFEWKYMDDTVQSSYSYLNQFADIITYFSFLSIFISCLGLFGLASFIAEQRTREIGIRKTLGSPVAGIIILLSKEFTRWVMIANIVAWPVAWYLMDLFLNDFAYKTEISLLYFFISGFIALFIAIITVSSQSLKAALINPSDALRYE